MGTVNLLAALMQRPALRTILVVTSDKVYDNDNAGRAFREDDRLAGDDPYSASKAATELVARSWRKSFLSSAGSPALGVARAGNVIGGGDWGEDRLVPDVIRAGIERLPVALRYPDATRPWQHVLDLIAGYLSYAERLTENARQMPTALNFGPSAQEPALSARQIAETLQKKFDWQHGWVLQEGTPLPEKSVLSLDPSLAYETLGWRPKLAVSDALEWTARWHRAHMNGEDMRKASLSDIAEFTALPVRSHKSLAAE
jgi:CDP-glucose 4,6-dehydratase